MDLNETLARRKNLPGTHGAGRIVFLCVVSIWLQLLGAVLFAYGFFPLPSNYATEYNVSTILANPSERSVGQVVIMVIDALRVDHIFTNEALKSMVGYRQLVKGLDEPKILLDPEMSQSFVGKVHVPTVTMPRIKAISSGTVPGMSDFFSNFNTQEMLQDNLIRIWVEEGRRIAFYGDDTWIKLFPNSFVRSDGTHSFFVNDYKEVDDNVTRHIDEEMTETNDWDVMILHYLGLDHIGHVVGPKSPLISHKLEEMSRMVRKIQDFLLAKRYKDGKPPLLIVLGDHGMADEGSHGGSSFSETNTPISFISPVKFVSRNERIQTVKQQDLAPTLALLTGVRIPGQSIGVAIDDVLRRFIDREIVRRAQIYNAEQIAENLKHALGDDVNDDEGYREFLIARSKNASLDLPVEKMISRLEESLPRFNMEWVVLGIILTAITLMASVGSFKILVDPMTMVMVAFHLARIFSYGSSSFVEEEHNAFYFTTITIISMAIKSKISVKALLIILALGILRRWNQTGDKWSHLPDIADFLMEHRFVMSVVHVVSLVSVLVLKFGSGNGRLRKILLTLVVTFVYLQKSAEGHVHGLGQIFEENDQIPARITYALALAIFIIQFHENRVHKRFSKYFEGCVTFILPVLLTLSHPKNTAILCGFLFVEEGIQNIIKPMSVEFKTLVYYSLGFMTFFCQGNSNSVASIDVGAGYIGLQEYYEVPVIILISVNTYGGPILFFLLLMSRLSKSEVSRSISILVLLRNFQLLFILVVTACLRFHLFVWTVFLPKVMYESATTIIYAILITVVAIQSFYSKE